MEHRLEAGAAAVAGGCASGGCGTDRSNDSAGGRGDKLAHLPEHIRAKVHNHPCFSEEAHHHYARMHVAVAPACNIQCHYCNRKYDCSNESRPGVVSEVMSPEQAVKKTLAVAAAIPQMTVLGIAGPGDPLANPERTLATFRGLSAKAPDIKLCVSTNGLALPGLVDAICEHNIDHVTITINCVDPEIGAKIYPWIFWNNRRITGTKAARILIEQQQKGLQMLTERGVLVKVNSVLIPGVNDEHLKEVSRVVKAKGAFLHNVMPLIAEPEHGTFYGIMGQRGPSHAELQALQDACAQDGAGDMAMMRHCRQCRADAVGMLGEDRGAEFTLDKIEHMEIDYDAAMRRRAEVQAAIEANRNARHQQRNETFIPIAALQSRSPAASVPAPATASMPAPATKTRPVLMAVATTGGGMINQHFGHAREFLIYEASSEVSSEVGSDADSPSADLTVRFVGTRKVEQYCAGGDTCGDAQTASSRTIGSLAGCEVVLCSKIGYEPWGELEAAGILPNGEHAMEPIEHAVAAVYREMAEAGQVEVSVVPARLSA